MNLQIEAIAKELKDSVLLKESEFSGDIINEIPPIISILKDGFIRIKALILNYKFENELEEITFFKETKPKLFYKLIYYRKMHSIEQHRPVCGYDTTKEFLENQQEAVNSFYRKNNEFVQYYRSGNTVFDKYYFLKNSPEIELNEDSFSFERDPNFSTNCDFKATELLANDMLASYLDAELAKLKHNELSHSNTMDVSNDKWTDTKAGLAEIIYAIHAAHSVNHGNIDLKVLAAKFGAIFNADIGDIYHTFLEIRSRKGVRTVFLNRLSDALNKRMDEADGK
ncbi:MAG: RteC domain-containing protein [Prevotellaceae bacterium]|jgi:hypothetical protein|nr:RteC domain-containing protein [Prevotellaceae bacterium]